MDFEIKHFSFGDTTISTLSFSEYDTLLYLSHLTDQELERYYAFKHVKRKREFVATRILRHSIFGFKHIHYNSVGAPYIEDEGFISISHAENLVGIAMNPFYQVGLDLELIRDKAVKLRSKFLNEQELTLFKLNDEEIMTACWSAKETLYKLAGRKEIDFKKDLHLYNKEENFWEGKIINPSTIFSVNLQILKYKGYIITFNSTQIETSHK